MLARSLKNIWTDEKLVKLCSAKDKMVSNLTTILQFFLSSTQWLSCSLSLLSVQLLPVWGGLCYICICCFATCVHFTGGSLGWVKSGDVELSHWLQAILFRARGGYRSGEELQGITSSTALSLHPPRACWGLVECARLELSSWPFSYDQSVLKNITVVLFLHTSITCLLFIKLWLVMEILPSWLSMQIAIAVD